MTRNDLSTPEAAAEDAIDRYVELPSGLLRRVLSVFAFDNCDQLFWRFDNDVMSMHVMCSDFFDWGSSDCEPVETESDVAALEQARRDLTKATGDSYSLWVGELYAARRRKMLAAPFMFSGKYALDQSVQELFREAAVAASSVDSSS